MVIERKRYDEKYYPSKEALEYFIWEQMYLPEENKTAKAHFQLIDHIYSKNRYKVVECTRGLGKSTIVTRKNPLYWIFKGKKPNFGEFDYILVIQDSVSMVESTFETLLGYIENSELKNHLDIKKKRLGDDPTIHIWNKDKQKMFFLKGRGSGQSMRGINIHGKRPNIIILDDIENEEKHSTKESRQKLKNWFFNVVVPSINPNRFEFIFIGTPIHEDALLMNLVESEKWATIQLPVAEEYPADKVISCWEDRFTKEYIEDIYKMLEEQGKVQSFYQEYMLEVVPGENKLFDMEKINEYSMLDMKDKLPNFTYYVSVDLAVSEREYADYTAIAVIGVDESNNWFLVDGFFGRVKPDETIDRIFEFVAKWKPASVVLEKVAFQLSMKTFIQNEMIKRGKFFNLEMVSRNKSKLSVIKAFQPLVELNRFWIPKDYIQDFVKELKHEMSLITNDEIKAKHDDLIDAISQLTLIDLIYVNPVYDTISAIGNESFINPYII